MKEMDTNVHVLCMCMGATSNTNNRQNNSNAYEMPAGAHYHTTTPPNHPHQVELTNPRTGNPWLPDVPTRRALLLKLAQAIPALKSRKVGVCVLGVWVGWRGWLLVLYIYIRSRVYVCFTGVSFSTSFSTHS